MDFKFKCIGYNNPNGTDDVKNFLIGKVYEAVNGIVIDEHRESFKSWSTNDRTFAELQSWFEHWYQLEFVEEILPEPEEKNCSNCRYDHCRLNEEPCVRCKNAVISISDKYKSRPFLWESAESVKTDEPVNDPVNHPSHYTKGKIEVADFIADQKLNFDRGNAVKYVCRAGSKDPEKEIQDLEKAIWYIKHEIKMLKGEDADAAQKEN